MTTPAADTSVEFANDNSEVANFLDSVATKNKGSAISKNLRNSRYSYIAGDHGLTRFTGALAIISTCVGGGVVGLPLAFYRLGLPTATVLNILVILMTVVSTQMYLLVKDGLPDSPESLYEIGYMLLGTKSIYALACILIVNSFGLCLIYFIVFG
jgi:hypothetical protein